MRLNAPPVLGGFCVFLESRQVRRRREAVSSFTLTVSAEEMLGVASFNWMTCCVCIYLCLIGGAGLVTALELKHLFP